MTPTITLHFENCEALDIAPEDVTFLHMSGIADSMTYTPRYQSTYKSVAFVRLSVEDKPEYRRIMRWNDVVCMAVDGVDYYVRWHEDDEVDNRYQKSVIEPYSGDISVVITKEA
ncbi:hypothetical protein RJP21_04825 [Paenibacillus sp. VCA1]|uniref:hypothetical protein n=1 Tax=Paenibacillus sp. VCA1 TaxID=3039148 RepID=UPI0028727B31|nr:hypothetical protein [Paenibacillus sp. VCA1]MDR9852924.1 hypothetical protein [Paenibacillus sp. VCA1]